MSERALTYEAVQSKLAPAMADATTVGDAVRAAASLWPDRDYLTFAPTGETLTFTDVHRQSNRLANALADIGVEPGDRVGIYYENSPAFVVAIYACAKLGAIQAPINWKYREREVTHAIEAAEISTVLVQADDDYHERLAPVAADYDPQPFHLGDDADDAAPFDGLVASGLHSYCACNRLATEAFFGRVAFLGGRGVDDLRWHRPVKPGDALTVGVEVVDKRVSESDPRRGYVDVDVTGRTPEGDPAVTWRVLGMIRREDPAATSEE